MTCVFCTDVTRAGEILEEDERSWVVRHPQGQWMIVAKRHAENVSDLDEDEWLHLARVWHRAERRLREETKAERVMVMKLGIQSPICTSTSTRFRPTPRARKSSRLSKDADGTLPSPAAGPAASSPPRRTQARDACGPAGADAGVPLRLTLPPR